MVLVLGLRHKPICIAASLTKHACKEVCDVKPGLDHMMRVLGTWFFDFVAYYSQ